MTSTPPPRIALPPGPRSVRDARRWVVGRCRDLGRPELAECAEVGVSELVSNALLHGSTPIQVGMAGTTAHPRVEVRDASTDAPRIGLGPGTTLLGDDLDDDTLLTFGRGLGIVARVSRAWGADIDDEGKVVWFEPAKDVGEEATEGVVTGVAGPTARGLADPGAGVRTFVLRGVPHRLHVAFVRHYRELRREVRLLSLAHGATYPMARDLADLFTTLDAPAYDGLLLAVVDVADAAPHDHPDPEAAVDLRVGLTRRGAAELGRLAELLELTDVFCREERLLSLAPDREQQRFQQWFLKELATQGLGASPRSWHDGGRTAKDPDLRGVDVASRPTSP